MTLTTDIIVGIDYSMSSPSLCIHAGKSWNFSNCKFYFLTNKKKNCIKNAMFVGEMHQDFLSQEERFDTISNWALSIIPKNSKVFLEDYAFAAKGVVFNIGEFTGLLKHKLWKNQYNFLTFAPSTIKKFATGKGNSNKIQMYHSFQNDTKSNIEKNIMCKIGDSPMSDIIDSYYIAKKGFFHF